MIQSIISRAFKKAKRVKLPADAKIIFFSDCHRGDNSYADDFIQNRKIYDHAMRFYYDNAYYYMELGDGIELWENRYFQEIFEANKHGFLLLKQFHEANRLHMLYGNHDQVLKHQKKATKLFHSYFDEVSGTSQPFLPKFQFDESIVIEFEGYTGTIFLLHGHQADFFNYVLWRLSRFLVRYLWTPLQILGIKDPTSPAKNFKELLRVEKHLKKWSHDHDNQMLIAGHTHRPRFPDVGDTPYFNDGSCVHPRSITGIEIADGTICLIKWHTISNSDGTLKIARTVLEGPEKLDAFLKEKAPHK